MMIDMVDANINEDGRAIRYYAEVPRQAESSTAELTGARAG